MSANHLSQFKVTEEIEVSLRVLLVDCQPRPVVTTDHYYITEKTEPLGLQYLQAYLLAHGFEAEIIRWPEMELPLYPKGLAPRVVGISGLTYAYPAMRQAALAARKMYPDAKVIAGREHASALYAEVLREPNFDAVAVGEGEISLLALAIGTPFEDVPSLVWKDRQGQIRSNPRSSPLNPSRWAPPTRRKEWMRNIFTETGTRHLHQAGIMLGRGCRFNCEFCTARNMWGAYRNCDAMKTFEEVKAIRSDFGIRYYAFHDLMINGNLKILNGFLTLVEKSGIDIELFGMASATKSQMDFKLMKRAGMHEIGVGIEIPDDTRIRIGKGCSIAEVRNFVNAAKHAGIFIRCYLIVGWPWEMAEEKLAETYIDFLRQLPVNSVRIHFLTPFPGTQAWQLYSRNFLWPDVEEHYEHFTTMEPVLQFALRPSQLENARDKILRGYYTSDEYDALCQFQKNDPVLFEMNEAIREQYLYQYNRANA